jgi:DNA-3-methyladenine glycosylase II
MKLAPDASLTADDLSTAVRQLVNIDPDLAGGVDRYGPPPLWARPPGFATLTFIILEQQVSLASARAAFERLTLASGQLTPERFLDLDDATLLAVGFSRQKARYVRGLAHAILDGRLDLRGIDRLEDTEARAVLTDLTGIGPWTADIYLLLALGRADIWPATDLALVNAVQEVKGLAHRPAFEEMVELAEPWRPWRSVAARICWHAYLSRRGHRDPGSELIDSAVALPGQR